MARTGSLDGDGNLDLAGSDTSVSHSGPCRTQAQIIPFKFPGSSAAASAGNMAGDAPSSSPADYFESFGDLTRAVVMRLQSDLPRINVWSSQRWEETD
jgi:hypothetical protein